ncbi:MAG: O-antigen ligase family protein, partial [Ignavibacteria bacterium]
MEHRRLSKAVDNTILVCLTIQIAFVSISIAVSSIAFGIWVGLWFIQIIVTKKTGFDKKILSELKLINIFILAYFFFEIFSRFYALYPEGAFNNLKRLLLFLIFFVSIIKIINFQTLSRIIFIVVCTISFISVLEIFQYLLKFGELINQMSFSEIRIDYFNYPLTAGEIKMLVFFLVFPLLFIKEKFLINKKLFIIILLPVFISMILTQSRNVFLSVLICFIIFGLIVNRKFLAGLIIVIILSIMILPSEVLDRFKSIADPDHPSNAARLYMWDTGMKMFFDHPLTGIADSHIREIYSTY